eukprot:4740548-Amphidinium_carterae.1
MIDASPRLHVISSTYKFDVFCRTTTIEADTSVQESDALFGCDWDSHSLPLAARASTCLFHARSIVTHMRAPHSVFLRMLSQNPQTKISKSRHKGLQSDKENDQEHADGPEMG